MNKPKLIISSAYAAIITIVFVGGITIWAELAAPLKDWLKNFSGHHWTSKSIFSVLLYVALAMAVYVSPYARDDNRLKGTLDVLLASTAFGVVVLTLFYAGHHFQLF